MSKQLEIENKTAITLSDCVLAYQMGYNAQINDGKLTRFIKEAK